MAHTRAQTAAQRPPLPSPASNHQGNRPQGIQPRKGSSRQRVTRRAERNRLHPSTPSETPTPQVCPLSFVLYGSQAKLGHGSIGTSGACPEQRSQAQALNRTYSRSKPRPRPKPRSKATADISSTTYRRHIWRASDWQRRLSTH
ncbi:hypothetical protein VTK26DRAFT_1821 [Humicola hyalothermophila]